MVSVAAVPLGGALMSVDGGDCGLSRDFGISAELGVCEYAGKLSSAHPAAINSACFHIIMTLQSVPISWGLGGEFTSGTHSTPPITRPIARALVRPPGELEARGVSRRARSAPDLASS